MHRVAQKDIIAYSFPTKVNLLEKITFLLFCKDIIV